MSVREVGALMRHPRSVAYVIVCIVVVILAKVHGDVTSAPLYKMSLLWANSVLAFYAFYWIALKAARRLNKTLWTPALLILLAYYQTFVGAELLTLLDESVTDTDDLIYLFLFHAVVLLLVEWIYVSFLLPGLLAQLRARAAEAVEQTPEPESPPADDSETRPVVVMGQYFAPDDILYISAREHLVCIVTAKGEHVLRARLGDIEAQMPPDQGLRVHRSHWVSRPAVETIRKSRDGWAITMQCGVELPVARGRRDSVERFFDMLTSDS